MATRYAHSALWDFSFFAHLRNYHVQELAKWKRSNVKENYITLSIGAIAGIAVVGGILIFGALTIFGVYLARKRSKKIRRTSERKFDLGDGEDDMEDFRSHQKEIKQLDHSSNLFEPEQSAKLQRWHEESKTTDVEKPGFLPPAYAFHITGVRESWPLVTWATTPTIPDVEAAEFLPRRYDGPPTGLASLDPSKVSRPPPSHHGPLRYGGSPQRRQSSHSASSSLSSIGRTSPRRKSVSDNHLTSILRSTSQRLRDAQTQRGSQSTNNLQMIVDSTTSLPSKGSQSKKENPPSGNSNSCDVSNMRNFDSTDTSAPMKLERNQSLKGNIKDSVPVEISDDDSLCENTFEHVPSALTSRSKRRERRESAFTSSQDSQEVTMIHQNNRASLGPFGARDIFGQNFFQSESVGDDPFSLQDGPQNHDHRSQNRKPTFGNTLPLQPLSDNLPSLQGLGSHNFPVGSHPQLFSWTNSSSDPFKPLRTQCNQPSIRGHKRSQVIRVSTGLRRQSIPITIVPEEPEETPTPHGPITTITAPSPSSSSMYSQPSHPPSTRPPSIAKFTPFLPFPSISRTTSPCNGTDANANNRISNSSYVSNASDASYSATLSLYDFYSTPEILAAAARVPSPTRTPSQKKKSRHARDFSVESTTINPLAANPFVPVPDARPPIVKMLEHASAPPLSTPSSNDKLNVHGTSNPIPATGKGASISTNPPGKVDGNDANSTKNAIIKTLAPAPQRSISRIAGPREQPKAPPRDSIQYSVGMLRRMNSEVSAYNYTREGSAGTGDQGSPTLPGYRGGGIGSSNSFRQGGRNYLSLATNARQISEPCSETIGNESAIPRPKTTEPIRTYENPVPVAKMLPSSSSPLPLTSPTPTTSPISPDSVNYNKRARSLSSHPVSPPKAEKFSSSPPEIHGLGLRMPILDMPLLHSPQGMRIRCQIEWNGKADRAESPVRGRRMGRARIAHANFDSPVNNKRLEGTLDRRHCEVPSSPRLTDFPSLTMEPTLPVLQPPGLSANPHNNAAADNKIIGVESQVPTATMETNRFSDATLPPLLGRSVRQISKMEMPIPRTPPKKGWEGRLVEKGSSPLGSPSNPRATQTVFSTRMGHGDEKRNVEIGKGGQDENIGVGSGGKDGQAGLLMKNLPPLLQLQEPTPRNTPSRSSIELYDEMGFLRSSPEREKVGRLGV
jgi:hypothetical protein